MAKAQSDRSGNIASQSVFEALGDTCATTPASMSGLARLASRLKSLVYAADEMLLPERDEIRDHWMTIEVAYALLDDEGAMEISEDALGRIEGALEWLRNLAAAAGGATR